MGETWKRFKHVPTIMIAAADGKAARAAHMFYAAYNTANNEDILQRSLQQ